MLLSELAKSKEFVLKYNDTLSSKLWNADDTLKSDVLSAIRRIADEFIKTLEVIPESIQDIIITGSMCNYNYTKYSDIDLHIVLDYSQLCDGCIAFSIADCMNAKKSLWNERHDITIYDMDVELYAQDVDDKITGNAGVFSIKNNKWLKHPVKETDIDYDGRLVMDKAKHIMSEIDDIVDAKINNLDTIKALKTKIQNMRKAGLERYGEFSMENLVFKVLRNGGYLEKLSKHTIEATDDELSL